MERVLVLGGGGWGTALALVLDERGAQVTLFVHDAAYGAEMAKTRRNPRYLPGVELPERIEVVSDPTNPLALEAAGRLRRDPGTTVRLATLHQTLRMQPVPAGAGFTRHFRLFALADAGRARGDDAFETEAVVAHLEAGLRSGESSAAMVSLCTASSLPDLMSRGFQAVAPPLASVPSWPKCSTGRLKAVVPMRSSAEKIDIGG